MKCLAVDVGILNLAIVMADFTTGFKITHAELVDMTCMPHVKIPRASCKLHHTNDACDRVDHVIQEYSYLFEDADQILIERQPPTGLVHVEQLLYSKYRNKAVLLCPRSLHKWMGIGFLNYEQRKEATVKRASQYMTDFKTYATLERKHDIADAVCYLLWQYDLKRIIDKQTRRLEATELKNTELDTWFDKFTFQSSQSSQSYPIVLSGNRML